MKRLLALFALLLGVPSLFAQATQDAALKHQYYSQAFSAADIGQYDVAKRYALRELQAYPRNGYAAVILAICYLSEQQSDSTLYYADEALRLLPKKDVDFRSDVYCLKAIAYDIISDSEKETAALEKAVKLSPKRENVLEYLASCYVENIDAKGLAATLKKFEKAEMEGETVDFYRAHHALLVGDTAAYFAKIDRLIEAKPASAQYLGDRAYVNIFRDDTVRVANDLIEVVALGQWDDNVDRSIWMFDLMYHEYFIRRLIEAAEARADARERLLRFALDKCMNVSDWDNALAVQRMLYASAPSPQKAAQFAQLCYVGGRMDEGRALLDEGMKADSLSDSNLAAFAKLMASAGEYDRAARVLEGSSENLRLRATYLYMSGDKAGARRELEQAMERRELTDGNAWIDLATLLEEAGETDAARRVYARVLEEQESDTAGLLSGLDYCSYEATAVLHGEQALEELLEEEEEIYLSAQFFNAARAYMKLGKKEKAMEYLRELSENASVPPHACLDAVRDDIILHPLIHDTRLGQWFKTGR